MATMDDSFRSRVERIFGSLTTGPTPPSSTIPSPWSLTDDEVEKREWKRGSAGSTPDRDDLPCSASFDDVILTRNQRRRRTLSDLDEDEEELDIRASIGLDRTLDNEEEEDEYDKVAEGRENAGERLYMKEVMDEGSYLNFHMVIPESSYGDRDWRANHLAAQIRLQEHDGEAQKLNLDHGSGEEENEGYVQARAGGGEQVRSILKRKSGSLEIKLNKKVRFDPSCKTVCLEDQDVFMSTSCVDSLVSNEGSLQNQMVHGVPDYLRNPSKYTCYSFDSSSETDEKSNTQAYLDFLKLVKGSNFGGLQSEVDDTSSGGLPKSVTFIPKRKMVDVESQSHGGVIKQVGEDDGNQSLRQTGFPVGIAVGESLESDNGAMEEDEPHTVSPDVSSSFNRPGRRYRTKPSSEDNE